MTKTIDRIKRYVKEKPIRKVLGLGLAGLVTLTALKDNVNFAVGSLNLHNPQKNQYTWGLVPSVNIEGENAKANIYTWGIFPINTIRNNSKLDGNMNAYGLIIGGNKFDVSSSVNNMDAYGLIAGDNGVGEGTQPTGELN